MSSPAPEPTTGDTPHGGAVVEVGSLAASGRRDARPQTGALEALLAPRDADDEGTVRVVDTAEQRVRHPIDLVNLVLCAVGVAVVMLMSVYAHGTTEGVAEDVQNFSDVLARVLFLPVTVLEGLITLFVPLAVLVELGLRRLGRQVVESIVAAALGLLLGVLVVLALRTWGSDDLIRGLSAFIDGSWQLTIPDYLYVAAIAGLLTAAGTRTRRRTVKWSWNLLFVAIGVVLITGQVSLPGIIITLLLGVAGLAVRSLRRRSERATGPTRGRGPARGVLPVALVRVRDVTDDDELAEAADDPSRRSTPRADHGRGAVGVLRAPARTTTAGPSSPPTPPSRRTTSGRHPDEAPPAGHGRRPRAQDAPSDPAAIALTRAGDNRVYAMLAEDDVRRDVVVLDGDRQVVGFLTRFWRSLRLRGSEGRAAISLRAAAERTALLSYAARAAGVRTPRLLGVAESADSMVLVQEHATGAVSLRDLPVEDLTGSVLNEAWRQLRLAHSAGIAHRALTSDVVLVSHEPATGAPEVWLTGWEQGDIASSELARRMDLAQMVALLALRVGAQRAVESAVSVLPDDDIAAIGPLLQSVALPPSTREEIRQDKELLKELRAALVERLPEADVEPQRITRFGARTVLTIALVIAAVTALVTSFNFEQIAEAVTEANPWWAVLSFVLGILTWVGAALTLTAFSPKRLPFWRVNLTQAAGSYVALAAPAGIGPAALNLRLLTKRGISTPMAVATVALVQVSQFVVTILILVVLSVFTGEGGLVQLPSTTVLLAIGGVALAVLATLLVPAVRTWALAKLRPTVQQVWPRLSEMLGQPGRLAVGLAGNIVMTLGYVLAFDAALAAFGQELDLVDVAVIYLVGNAAGAAVPTPGGLGTIELALTAGLTAAGVPVALATSATLLFRVATYWARIPIGWFAMRFLQKKGDL
nr:lysylphosphatidylglycerol synthase domain-containing protein [Cellulosimicrobium sp. MM]